MSIWNKGGFFSKITGHVIKWWQLVFLPVFTLNNNGKMGRNKKDSNNNFQSKDNKLDDVTQRTKQILDEKQEKINKAIEEGKRYRTDDTKSTENNTDPMKVLSRLEREKLEEEQRRQKEIEEVRKQAQEKARIASILNANKVDVNAFIEVGKASCSNKRETTKELSDEEVKKQEEIKRAQEIIERLNREAAEDEAKKKAEIEEAKRQAMGR